MRIGFVVNQGLGKVLCPFDSIAALGFNLGWSHSLRVDDILLRRSSSLRQVVRFFEIELEWY